MTLTKGTENQIRIRGIILPAVWDKKGNPIGFDLSTYTEEYYRLIIEDPKFNIAPYLHEQVEVQGRILDSTDQNAIIIHQITLCLLEHFSH